VVCVYSNRRRVPMRARGILPLIVLIASFGVAVSSADAGQSRPNPERFENTITAWEAEDRAAPPPEDAIVFVGSSSIRFWESVHEDMAPLTIIHRGFGGSWMQDATHYADRIVTNYKPRAVVVYEGDNDVGAASMPPEQYLTDLRAFVSRVHDALPTTRIYILAIKPSVSRWANWELMDEANHRTIAEVEGDDRLFYVDVATPMLGPNQGRPPEDMFVADMLHMNEKGYEIWTDVVRPFLMEREARFEE
jgi:lysophospholipase L1-like esterase